MTFSQLATTSLGSTMRMRSAKPSHVEWKPSAGQVRARDFLTSSTRGALWADPGAGKTSITLAAYVALRELGLARTMLVVAPLRVCQLQWRQEAKQWTQFKDLKVTFLHGDKKGKLLHSEPSDIYLINFDGLVWLSKQFRGNLPFDIVCLDESTKIKNYSAERSKALRRCTAATRYKWMLTGTPSPNGYMDLFGQFLWLDGGQALGKHVTAYREKYFKPAFNGFDYTLQKGGDERIELAIAKLVHRLPFTDLPPLTNDVRWVTMSPEAKRIHKALNDDQVVVIGEHTIVAGSTGALQSAREQAANGALYVRPGEHEFVAFDDGKLDALDELIEEMNGQPLLIAFQFHHDIERIKARRGDKIAVLAGGVSAKEAERIQTAWNAGEISELYVHPASIGHGLNLQRGGAAHLCWFSATFDLELWEQLIRRIWRQGNRALKIVNHILAMVGTIDVDKLEAIEAKSVDQAQLLQAMSETPAQPDQKETTMTERLGPPHLPPHGALRPPLRRRQHLPRLGARKLPLLRPLRLGALNRLPHRLPRRGALNRLRATLRSLAASKPAMPPLQRPPRRLQAGRRRTSASPRTLRPPLACSRSRLAANVSTRHRPRRPPSRGSVPRAPSRPQKLHRPPLRLLWAPASSMLPRTRRATPRRRRRRRFTPATPSTWRSNSSARPARSAARCRSSSATRQNTSPGAPWPRCNRRGLFYGNRSIRRDRSPCGLRAAGLVGQATG